MIILVETFINDFNDLDSEVTVYDNPLILLVYEKVNEFNDLEGGVTLVRNLLISLNSSDLCVISIAYSVVFK